MHLANKVPTKLISLPSYDYLKITNEINETFGVYCGERTGRTVTVTGNYVVMIFHSNEITEKRGFFLSFTAIPLGKCNNNGVV